LNIDLAADLEELKKFANIEESGPAESDLVFPGSKIALRAHSRAFLGCFSIRMRKQINWKLFTSWKEDPKSFKQITDVISDELSGLIVNNYDVITTAPPSRKRDLDDYSAFELGRAVSRKTGLPFRIAFKQRQKKGHGRFKSVQQGITLFRDDWDIEDMSVLWIDDFINTGATASLCFNLLAALGNHVDGLVWCMGGN